MLCVDVESSKKKTKICRYRNKHVDGWNMTIIESSRRDRLLLIEHGWTSGSRISAELGNHRVHEGQWTRVDSGRSEDYRGRLLFEVHRETRTWKNIRFFFVVQSFDEHKIRPEIKLKLRNQTIILKFKLEIELEIKLKFKREIGLKFKLETELKFNLQIELKFKLEIKLKIKIKSKFDVISSSISILNRRSHRRSSFSSNWSSNLSLKTFGKRKK